MARMTVDIPDSVLGEEKAKELTALRRRVKTLETKIAKLEATDTKARQAIETYRNFRRLIADQLDLYEDYPDDW